MPNLCATVDGEPVCMPVDLTVFTDPRQSAVPEEPGDAPGPVEVTGVPVVHTRVARGAVPDAWPRGARLDGELVKSQERIPCQLLVRPADVEGNGGGAALDVLLFGDAVFRAILGRAP